MAVTKKNRERMWFFGRVGISVRWSGDHKWDVTQEKSGDRHTLLWSVTTIHRKDEPTLYSFTVGPASITIGDALGRRNA